MYSLRYTVNQAVKATRAQHNGTEYLIAPVIAIKAGVMNEELVPHDEIAAHFAAWDGRPFVLDHPKDSEGNDVSANHPDILAAIAVGQFFNSQLVDSSIRGEVWVDVIKARKLGGDALTLMQRLEAGQPVEVSTAYWRDLSREAGEFDGQEYAGVARNLRPDHIAALLNDQGACSWEDGCGVPRVNQDAEPGGPDRCVCPECGYGTDKERGTPCRSMTCPECSAKLIAGGEDVPYPNEHAIRLADPDQFARVRRQNDKFGEGIHAIWGVKEDNSTELQAIRFDKDKFGEAEAKAWLEEHDYPTGGFEPATDAGQKTNHGLIRNALAVIANAFNMNLQSSQEANTMNELIAKIVEDGRLGLNEEELGSLPEALLAKLAEALANLPKAQETEPEAEPVPQEEQESEPEPQANRESPAGSGCSEQLEALIGEFGGVDGMRQLLANARAITDERKQQLVADVAANSRLTEAQLESIDEEALVALRAELVPADYSGRGGGSRSDQDKITPLVMPSLFGENGGN